MIELIQRRLEAYKATNPIEENQAVKEILQEVILYCLWRADFFEVAAFQGGTSLRILHQLPRFSEDLDFILKMPDPEFQWHATLQRLIAGLTEFGLRSEVLDKSKMDRNIREALLKDDAIGNQLNLRFYQGGARPIKIKLEIDTKPPAHSGFEYSYLDFPLDFEVCHQGLPSNFALKIHALLCRPYIKGRDWYDFSWYVKQRVAPNLLHLGAALNQIGPWQSQDLTATPEWLAEALLNKIATIDWQAAAADVERFLSAMEKHSLKLWSEKFFQNKITELVKLLSNPSNS